MRSTRNQCGVLAKIAGGNDGFSLFVAHCEVGIAGVFAEERGATLCREVIS